MINQQINSQTINQFSRWKVNDALAFFMGLFALIYVNVIGQLYISEILLILLTPILWWRRGRALFWNTDVRKIIGLGALWLLSQIITDFIRQTPAADIARGWSAIVVFLVCFSGLYLLLGDNIRRILIFACGYALSGALSPFVQPSSYSIAEPWKFGFGPSIVLLAFLFVIILSQGQLKRMRKWVWLIMAVGILSIFLNARSLGGVTIFSGVILWLRTSAFTRRLLARIRVQNLFLTGLLLASIAWGLLSGYAYLAEQGLFGQDAKSKFEMQYNGSILGFILGGRTEILASSRAILDSPIIGHGSWARDAKYRLFFYQISGLGYQINLGGLENYVNKSDLIPAHSHITQAWVWAGLLGAIFWGWTLIFVGKAFFKANLAPNGLYPLVIYLGIAAVWDLLFSPFGSLLRLAWALRFVVFLSMRRLVSK